MSNQKTKYANFSDLRDALSCGDEDHTKIKVWVNPDSVNIWEWDSEAEIDAEQGQCLLRMGDSAEALVEVLKCLGLNAEIP